MIPEASVEKLLHSLFSMDQLRLLLRRLPKGRGLADRIQLNLAPAAYFPAVVEELTRAGWLALPAFWDALIDERPLRRADIIAVRATFEVSIGGGGETPPAPLTVLMVSANPDGQARMRVDKEFQEVVRRVQGAEHRDRLHLVPVLAARFEDLGPALMRHKPHVLHLSTHGELDGTLLFEANDRSGRLVPRENLIALLQALRGALRMVVINACNSHLIARDLPAIVDVAIGMSDNFRDRDAIEFAVAFYEALAFAQDVTSAFDYALSGLDARSAAIPRLYPPADKDPDHKRRLRLFAPS